MKRISWWPRTRLALAQCAVLLMPFLALGCRDSYKFKTLPQGPINHHLIAVAKTTDGVRARGFAGATPANTEIFFEIDRENKRVRANADGSFLIDLPLQSSHSQSAEFTFNNSVRQVYNIRDLSKALANVAKAPFSLEGESGDVHVDDIAIVAQTALLLSSNSASVTPITIDERWVLEKKKDATYILLNPEPQTALLPRSIAGNNNHALVSLMGSNELALLDLKNGAIITKSLLKNTSGSLFLFDLNPPLLLKTPIKADNGTTASKTINRSFAHTPDTIVALGEETFVVSYANYYQYEDKEAKTTAVLGPGIIALISTKNNTIETQNIVILPYKNPLFIIKKSNREFWVICSGTYAQTSSELVTADAGLLKLELTANKKSMRIINNIPLQGFVPAEATLVGNKLIIPEAFGQRLAILDESVITIAANDLPTVQIEDGWQFVFAAYWHEDIIFLGDVSGSLIAYSIKEGWFPFPFIEPIRLDPSLAKTVAFFPHKILFRHQNAGPLLQDAYPAGFSAWVISQLASKVVPLDLLEVFGP